MTFMQVIYILRAFSISEISKDIRGVDPRWWLLIQNDVVIYPLISILDVVKIVLASFHCFAVNNILFVTIICNFF